jgi:hypothetical protein
VSGLVVLVLAACAVAPSTAPAGTDAVPLPPTPVPMPTASPGAPTEVPAPASWRKIGEAPNADGLTAIVGSDAGYVGLGFGAPTPGIWFSPNGVTWQPVALPMDPDRPVLPANVSGLASSGTQVLALGGFAHAPCQGGGDQGGDPPCMLSPITWLTDDGMTWRRSDAWPTGTDPQEPAGGTEVSAAWAVPGGWEAVLIRWEGESGIPVDVWRSADGIAWEHAAETPAAPGSVGATGGVTAADGTRLRWDRVGICPADGECRPETLLRTSMDGTTWSDVDGFPGSGARVYAAAPPAAGGASSWVLAGATTRVGESGALVPEPAIWRSRDLSAWSAVELDIPPGYLGEVTGLAWSDRGLVAVAPSRSADATDGLTWTSPDGEAWTQLAERQGVELIAFGPAGVLGLSSPYSLAHQGTWWLAD